MNRALSVVRVATVALVLCGPGARAAESARPPLVVLDVEAKGVTPLQADAATQSVVRGLRELDVFQVLASSDVRQLLAIDRTRQLSGTSDGSGISDLAKLLGAQHVVIGSMTPLGGKGLQVEIRLLDTAKNTVLAQKTLGPLATIDQVAARLPPLAQELVAVILQGQQGGLLVQTPEEGVEVWVDDVLAGSTPQKAALKLARGSHRVQVRKDGFIAQLRTVRISPDQVAVEPFTMVPSADYAEAFHQRHGRLRIGALVATGAAVLAIAGAIVVDRAASEPLYQNEFLPRRFALTGVVLSDLPANVRDTPSLLHTYEACGANPTACRSDIGGLQGQLIGLQVLTGGLAVIGVGSAAVATYLWLTGQDPNRYANLVAASVTLGKTPGFALTFAF